MTYSLAGYPAGYPVLIDTHLTEKRTLQLLTYLSDGGLLNPKLTKTMSMEAIIYNPTAIVFGYVTALFKWKDGGEIEMTIDTAVSLGQE